MSKSNIDRLTERLTDATVTVVLYRGRRYAVTSGTGEHTYGTAGGGPAAYAYRASDLRAADLRPEGWSYSDWCQTISPVEDAGLARVLARRHGLRLTREGACEPVLSDTEWLRAVAVRS